MVETATISKANTEKQLAQLEHHYERIDEGERERETID